MQIEQSKLLREQTEYEAYPLLITMQAFLDYATHMVAYSSLVHDFIGLNEEMLEATESVMAYATDMREMYHRSLMSESVEDILEREESILDEIEMSEFSLTLCESSLDKYLIFADTQPEIHSAFLTENGLPLFSAASC